MATAAARRSRKSPVKSASTSEATEPEGQVTIVSTTEVAGYEIQDLGDYEFVRVGAGRKREPSPFDDAVEQWVGTGTRRIPVGDREAAENCIKDLQKATEFRNRGLEKRIETMEDGELFVVFRVNAEKAKRAARKPRTDDVEAVAADLAETD